MKISHEEFINKARAVHGDKYEYPEKYINSNTKISIICKFHGLFNQKPYTHISHKANCPACSRRKTNDDFLNKAIKAHGVMRYEYPESYIKENLEINIICRVHGMFKQRASSHFKHGCLQCGRDLTSYKITKSKEEFVIEANLVHNSSYEYPDNYINGETKIGILCKKHGLFFVSPDQHIGKVKLGCQSCAKINSFKRREATFFRKANEIHNNKYSYFNDYIDMNTKIQIRCPEHGVFTQMPKDHLHSKAGCSKCTYVISKVEIAWLDYLKVSESHRGIRLKINGNLVKPDAFDPATNTIYEFYGDYWHGNPNNPQYPHDKLHPVRKITYGALYEKTMEKEKLIKDAGYNLITIWQSDWIQLKK